MRRSPSDAPPRLARPPRAFGCARCAILALTLHGGLALAGCASAPVRPAARCADERVVLATQADVAQLVACSTIASLVIRTGGNLNLSTLRAPLTITRDLVIGPTVAVDQVALPGVRIVEGTVRVVSNGLMQGLFLPALERAGRIEIDGNVAVTTITLPRLASVAGELRVTDNANLELLDLPALVTIGQDLVVTRNPKLSVLDAPQLARAGGLQLDAPALPADIAARLQATAAPPVIKP